MSGSATGRPTVPAGASTGPAGARDRAASGRDLERARLALALIIARGYHRGRDLAAEMDGLLHA